MDDNAWCDIKPNNYDAHASHPNAGQMQILNKIIKEQFELLPKEWRSVSCVAILGITNGNGLEHVIPCGIGKIIGIDINEAFLNECSERYPDLKSKLSLFQLNMMVDIPKVAEVLIDCDVIIANLLIKHIHLVNFIKIVCRLPKRGQTVSCVIQVNPDGVAIARTGMEHIFDKVSLQREEENEEMTVDSMDRSGYFLKNRVVYDVPNAKQFIRLDFIAV